MRKPMAAAVVLALLAGGYFVYKYFFHPAPKCIGILGRPLRVGIVSWPGYAGGIVANNGFKPNTDCIYYRQHNLCVEFLLMENIAVRAQAFARGGKDGVDIVWSTVDFWANELPGFKKNDVNARAIMQVDWSRGGDAIVADRSITKIEDLYTRTISLAKFTPSHWLLEYSLQNSSLDAAKQARIMNALVGKEASPDARADFVAGKVDATVVWEPDVTEALKRPNSHIVVSTHEAGKLIADVMVAREDFVREHPEVIEAFVQGWIVDGTVEANRHPEVAAKLLVRNELLYKALGLETTRSSLSTVKLAGLSDNAEMFNLDGKDKDSQPLFDRIFDQAAKSWVARSYISAPVSSAMAKDDSFLRKIYQRTPVNRQEPDVKPAPEETKTKPAITTVQIHFDPASAVLNTAAMQTLDERVALLAKTFFGAYIRVEGSGDNVGSADANRSLSLQRAQAVIDYLVTKHSLPREQFVPLGNGTDKPVSENEATKNSPEGRARTSTDIGVIK